MRYFVIVVRNNEAHVWEAVNTRAEAEVSALEAAYVGGLDGQIYQSIAILDTVVGNDFPARVVSEKIVTTKNVKRVIWRIDE